MATQVERGEIGLSDGMERCMKPDFAPWIPEGDHLLAATFPQIGDDLNMHRWQRVYPFLKIRDRNCWALGHKHDGRLYLHEAIRRSAVQGWPEPYRVLIQCAFNVILVCGLHHETKDEPRMLEVAGWMFNVYGRQYLDWLRALPFLPGAHPLKGFLEYHGVLLET